MARQRGGGARGRQRARRPAHRRAASATTSGFLRTGLGIRVHRSVANTLAYFAGPTSGATPADWWAAFSGYDNAYYDTLFYDDEWHTVRVEDRIHFSAAGRIRAAKVLAAAIQSALGMA